MSQEAIKEIIARAITDTEYKEMLFSDPDKALEGYELTEDETSALRGLENEHFDATAEELEERGSRAGVRFTVPGFGSLGRDHDFQGNGPRKVHVSILVYPRAKTHKVREISSPICG